MRALLGRPERVIAEEFVEEFSEEFAVEFAEEFAEEFAVEEVFVEGGEFDVEGLAEGDEELTDVVVVTCKAFCVGLTARRVWNSAILPT